MPRALPFFAMTVIALSPAADAWAADQHGLSSSYGQDQSAPLTMLTWPGKTAPLADVRETAPPAQAQPARAEPPRPTPTSLYDAPPPRWRANETPPQSQTPPSAATSARPTPVATESAGKGLPPHFYSVARQYGVQPDPVQLSSQFLAETPQADMAEPPPLPPPHTVGPQSANMSTAAATNQVRQAQEAAADADSAALGN